MIEKFYTVEITGVSHEGKGVGRLEGKVIFVKNALPGEVVKLKVTKVHKSYMEGETQSVISASPARIARDCTICEECSGCNFRYVTYDKEVELKTQIVRQTLKKIAGIDESIIAGCLPSPKIDNYRNKLQYHVRRMDGQQRFGFIGADFKFFPRIECSLAETAITNWAKVIEEYVPEGVTRVIIRRSYPEGKLLCLLLGPKRFNIKEKSIEKIMAFPKASAFFGNITSKDAEDIVGSDTYKIAGEDYLIENIKEMKYAVGPTSFFQINPYQTAKLYDTALADLNESDNLLDLFCGVGSITLQAAGRVKTAFGIEISEEAISYAKINAQLNNITNTQFLAGDVSKSLNNYQDRYSKIILDPPRKGCPQNVLEHIATKTDNIIYVSCESSTLARDLKILIEKGFSVEKVIPVDMFPRTAHVETVVLLDRK